MWQSLRPIPCAVCGQAEYAALAKLYPEEEEVVTGNILASWHAQSGATEFAGVLAQVLTGSAAAVPNP